MNSAILFVGPYSPRNTGQSVVFSVAFKSYIGRKHLVNTTQYNSKILNTLYTILISTYIIHRKNISVVYYTCSRSNLGSLKDLILISISYFYNLKIVNHLHGSDFNSFISNSPCLLRKIIVFSYNRVQFSIVLSSGMLNQFQLFKKMELFIIPNFFLKSLEKYLPLKSNNQIRILFLSNIMKSKGIEEFLDALTIIFRKDNYINIKVDICGAFIGDKYLSKDGIRQIFFNKYNMLNKKYANKVQFHGYTTGDKKYKILSKSDIFVLPSYSEGFPISILEAMRMGNVIITSNINYLQEIVTPKMGFTCDIDPIDIGKSIEKYLYDIRILRKTQKYNVQYAKLHYGEQQFSKRINTVLNNIRES